jgi:hypothetical protein
MTPSRATTSLRTVLASALGLVAVLAIPAAQATTPTQPPQAAVPTTIVFNRDVRPILSDKCFKCHGPATQTKGLRLDLEDVAKQPLRDGNVAVVPGDLGKSELVRRIAATDPNVRMPRAQSGPGEALSPRDVGVLQRWIEQGGVWQKHWAFTPPARPEIPKVVNRPWVRNPIDAFVLARLERETLKPSPAADRATLIRRVTLDLTGLPPTPIELDAFLRDPAPDAYEKVVNRLLNSPRYGERMAFPWLEAARYADTNGYQVDNERFMWRWRDWVIDAFNRDMPYDKFTVEQLAGDLLPNPTLDQRIATGFNRNHRGNAEGGVIDEEYAVESVVDRVDTTGTVFLGLTIGCARCHNHKYDPITQKDYYQLFAYFNNVPERGIARRYGNSPPFIPAPTHEQQWQLKQLDDKVAAANDAFAKLQPELTKSQTEWEGSLSSGSTPMAWGPARGLVGHYALDGDLSAAISIPVEGKSNGLTVQSGEPQYVPGRIGQAASFDGKRFILGGDIVGFAYHMSVGLPTRIDDERRTVSYDDPFTVAAWINPSSATGAIVTKAKDVAAPDNVGHALVLKDGKIQYLYVGEYSNAIRVQAETAIGLNQWHHVTLTYDGSRWASGVKIYVDGKQAKLAILEDDLNYNQDVPTRELLRIGAGGGPGNRFQGGIDEVRIYNRPVSAIEAAVLAEPTPVNEIGAIAPKDRNAAQADKIRDYFLERAAPQAMREAWAQVLDAAGRRDAFATSLPTVMVMQDMPTPRESHVLIRGAYDRPGEKVAPALPGVLTPPSPSAYPPNRLGLARWLVDPSNPLLARVTVNRFWQQYFGTGIVKTVEDFGSQGEPPSHPELLDWLATQFVQSAWDVKALQKTIVMSATYQQSSKVSPALLEKDPANRLLARGPDVRLTAEMIRDQALSIAGLLVDRIGGPSVKPYQPEGLWNEVGSEKGNGENGNGYVQDHGENLYRRSLYTFWKRTVPPPSMANFDASSRESHVVRVNATDTPLQALDLMNDVTYLEAARAFAQRVMHEGGSSPQERISYALRLATAHRPTIAESAILNEAFTHDLRKYQADPGAALKYVSYGESPRDERLNVSELAAYTSVANLVLNLNRTIVKD